MCCSSQWGLPFPSPFCLHLAQPLVQRVSLVVGGRTWGHTVVGQEEHTGLYFTVASHLGQENALWQIHGHAAPLVALFSTQCWVSSSALLHSLTGSNHKAKEFSTSPKALGNPCWLSLCLLAASPCRSSVCSSWDCNYQHSPWQLSCPLTFLFVMLIDL